MADEFIKRSQVTGKKYNFFSKDVVRILNLRQATAFIEHGVELIDIYTSRDRNTDKPVIVFVFDKESSQPVFDAWCKHELS